MSEAIITALISGAFTITGIVIGIIASSSLTRYRIKQLEEKVDKHNSLIERMYKVEVRVEALESEVKERRSV